MKHIKTIPVTLKEDMQNKLDAFRFALKKSGITFPDAPEIYESIKPVFAFSDFVAKNCTRNIEVFNDLVSSGDLPGKYAPGDYDKRLKKILNGINDDRDLGKALRKIRLREMIRIAWRDIAGWADLAETMSDLSAFADACIVHTLSCLHKQHSCIYGIPVSKKGHSQYLVVIGMGKLGAAELNFSSDIDLIFAYPDTGETTGTEKKISNDEFFTKLCRRLVKVLGEATDDGQVFRVDLRLRPYGENGPLVMDYDAMENYYQYQGREWERYAWIKARIITDKNCSGNRLLHILNPFVYRRYLDYGVFESLRDMKQMISVEEKRKGLRNNIKLGAGGIREIEFFAQIFQLIRGGVVPVLQERCLHKALKLLSQEKYISSDVCEKLLCAYDFLRNTEHRLQEFSDQQTHDLPSDPAGSDRLAASMGFESYKYFSSCLDQHMQTVHLNFNNLLEDGEPDKKTEYDEKRLLMLENIWLNSINDNECKEVLSDIGYEKPEEVLQLLTCLRDDPATYSLSKKGRERLDKLIPIVLKETGLSKQPVFAIKKIFDLIKAIERRACYISLLLENRIVLKQLVKLATASTWILSFLSHHPVLLDELIDPRILYSFAKKDTLETELKNRFNTLDPDDLELQIQELCIFKQVNILRVAACDITGASHLMRVSDHLTDIAESVLNKVFELSWDFLAEKHGIPACLHKQNKLDKGFVAIAYGKLGGIELGYGSDLDLVFLHAGTKGQTKGSKKPVDNNQFFSRLVQRAIHILTARTPAGLLYDVDMRLRPNGSSGMLVSHIEAFGDYQANSAWTWEHQALVRARPIAGDPLLADSFKEIRNKVLSRAREKSKLQKKVVDMREQMRKKHVKIKEDMFDLKHGFGGIVDIEFLVQYLVLLNAHEHESLLEWTDNVRIIEALNTASIIDSGTADLLREAYLAFRASIHKLNLQEKPAQLPASRFGGLRKKVICIWKAFMENKEKTF